jgi:hypothetical protein
MTLIKTHSRVINIDESIEQLASMIESKVKFIWVTEYIQKNIYCPDRINRIIISVDSIEEINGFNYVPRGTK